MSLTVTLVLSSLFAWTIGAHVLQRREILDDAGEIVLAWTADLAKKQLIFTVEAKTRGIIGVGFATGEGWTNGDFAVGWVYHGIPTVLDMYAENNEFHLDHKQDYQVLFGFENDTHTTLRFQRTFDTCDTRDWKITNDTVRVMYVYQNDDPINKTIVFQPTAKRGMKSFYLLEEPQENLHMTSAISIWDVRLPNIGLVGSGTVYRCKIFRAPKTSTKHQVIGFKPLTERRNRVHHMILYECHAGGSHSLYETHINDDGHECYSATMPKAYTHCSTILISWGVGSQGDVMPLNVGFPLGEEFGGATYFMLEVHYEMMIDQKQSVMDNSGLRLYLTNKVRSHDASVVNIGHVVSPLQIIPPGEKNFVSVAHCGSTCTKQLLPTDGVKIYSLTLSAHTLATGMTLRHIRNGIELAPIIDERNYDATYLQSHRLIDHIHIHPGDHLMLECTYDSSSKNYTVVGGLSMRNEMCLAFLQYYPRSALSECQSWPAIGLLTSWFNIKLGEEVNDFGVEETHQSTSKSLTELLKKYRWAGRAQAYQREIRFGKYFPFCLRQGRFPANLSVASVEYPQITFPHYVVSAACSVNTTQETMISYTKVMAAKDETTTTSTSTTTIAPVTTSTESFTTRTITEKKITGDWLDGFTNTHKWNSPSPPVALKPTKNIEPPNQANSVSHFLISVLFPFGVLMYR